MGGIMKFSMTKEELTNALSLAVSAISTNSTLPVMSGVLVNASDGNVTFEATDLDSSCKIVSPALVEEEGCTVLPGKKFFDIAKVMEDSRVDVTADDVTAFITCEQAAFTSSVLNASEFPGFPEIETSASVTFPFSKFQSMIKKVIKSASRDESKGIFTGVFLEVKEGKVRAVTSDSFRVAVAEESVDVEEGCEFEAIIPPHFLNGIISMTADYCDVCVAYNDNQVLIKVGNITFINRKLQGKFPNYRRLINPSNETTIVVDKSSLTKALKRVSVLREENTAVVFEVNVDENLLQLKLNTTSNGAATEFVNEVKCCGIDCVAGFDVSYINDGISSVGTNDVLLTISSGKQPAHIAPCVENRSNLNFESVVENDGNMLKNKFLYLVMPVIQPK